MKTNLRYKRWSHPLLWGLTCLLALFVGAGGAKAQVSVTVGSQVTDVANIVSGKAYLLRWDGLTGTPYALDTGGSSYGMANNNSASQAAVYYLISDGNGGYKIENAFTGKYWPTPSSNGQVMAPTTVASAGTWTIAASGTANRFTFTCGTYHTNRSSSKLVAHTSDSPVSIYEVTASTATSSSYSDLSGMDMVVSSTEASSLSTGTWYVMSQRTRSSYLFEDASSHTLKHTQTKPAGSATTNAGYLVRLLAADGGKYYVQNGYGNYFGTFTQGTNVPTTALGTEAQTVAKINSTDGHFYLQSSSNSVVLNANDFTLGDPSTVVGWGTTVPTATGNNNDWAFYPVTLDVSWVPTASEVYTIENSKASNRGALTYEPTASTTNVWSSYKSGATTLDATNPNHQWVFYPTGTTGQYYLYNVGAGKFAVPTAIGSGSTNPWVFSDNAVAVTLNIQSDGTYRIKMATDPVSGTNVAVISANSNLDNPIFNYNDAGSDFTITKVTGDASTAVASKVAKLVKSQTALTAAPTSAGWYAVQIKTAGTSSFVGRYAYPAATEMTYNGTNYPLTFTGTVATEPAINNTTFFTYIDPTNLYWQLPNGKYLVANSNNKFPTSTNEPTAINSITYNNGIQIKGNASYYAVPYNLSSTIFVGESTTSKAFDLYPINLTTAGLQDWRVTITTGTSVVYDQTVSCTRSDVVGLTEVYTGGTFFLPTGVTPASSDFTMAGSQSITVDDANHTVTVNYDPNIAIIESGVSVTQGFQTAGRNEGVMLLRVTAEPFKDATNATISVSLKDGTESQISALTLYEASSASSEVLTIFNSDDTANKMSSAPTLTSVNTVAVSGNTATLTIGNLTAGTHYYWIAATVNSDATLGSVLDAAVTGITYTCNSNETTLDLTSTGDPADRGAMVFNTRTYPFLPSTYDSRVYRIPAMVVADDGSIVVAADKRYQSHTDIGGGHVIDIVIRRSTDGGRTWSAPVTIAKGLGTADNDRCGYGDPSLVKGKNGKLYCLFAAGNLGYFYGQKHICMSTSTDNGVTWSSNDSTPPTDIYATDAIKNATVNSADGASGAAGGYGLYDYFVTSGKGLYTSDGILMYLIPAQTLTADNYTTLTDGTYWSASSDDYMFYSMDDGDTWRFSTTRMISGGDEAKVIEMNDGSLLGSVRKASSRRFNTATYSDNGDGTLNFTFGSQWDNSQLSQASQNNQDILYYQRTPKTGKTDVIFHSITTGNHVNFKLFYSLDQGQNWTEFLNVQTKGTRYVTLERGGTEANPGSLYMLFEDQSLNGDGGGYTDYNHYPLNFVEITREQLEALIPTLNDAYVANPTNDVKVVDGTTGEGSYGSWSSLVWTSNATSGKAGVTMTLSDGSHDKFSTLNSRYNLAYHPAAANTDATITLTAPAGYAITSYTAQAGVYDGTTYTLTKSDGTTITPPNVNGSDSYADLSMTGLTSQSEVITVRTTNASKWLSLANFTITLRRAVTYNKVDGSGNTLSSQLVVFETDDVADEMPTALKVAGYNTYTFYSDAACTVPVTEIGSLTNVYYQAPAVIRDGSIVTLKDQRNSMYVAVSADGYVRASKVLHPDCQWTLADCGDGTYNLVGNDGSYLSTVTVTSGQDQLMTTTATAPATGWQFVVDGDYYHIYNATNTTALHMPNWGNPVGSNMHNNFVISWGSSTQNDNGSRFTVEAAPAGLFLVSDDTHEYWYNLTTHRDNTDYAVELPAVGKAIFGNSTIQNTNMAQQWKFTRHATGGFNIVSRQDRSLFNREKSVGGNGFGSSDTEAADDNGERGFFPGYQASTGKYVIIGGKTKSSFQLHQGNWGHSYKLINNGSGTGTGNAYEFALTAAPTPVDNLTTGWYRIKVYKNPTLGSVAENALSGRYLYNQEVWSKLVNAQGGTGFFPFRVQEAAAQPDDNDADYFIHVEKDASGNVQLRSVNGHYVGTYGLANCNTPLLQVSDYTAAQTQTNLLGSFDGDGYNFVGKYGTTDAYFVPYVTTYGSENSASSPDALDVNHTAADNVWGTATATTGADMRYLLRPVDAAAVGLTEVSFTRASTYPLVDNDGTALPNPTYYIPSSKQHTAPRFRVTTTLAADVEEYYDGCTLFLPSGTQYATVLDQYMEGCKVHTFQINGEDRYVRSVPVGDANRGVLAIINTYILLMGEDAQAALHGVGPGYPSATHSARIRLEEINATTGKAFPGNSSTIDNYTDDDLIDIAAATDALFSETNIELPADGKSFVLSSYVPAIDIPYNFQSIGAPLLLSMNSLYSNSDPDAANNEATKGWKSFVWGTHVPTQDNPATASYVIDDESGNYWEVVGGVRTEDLLPCGLGTLYMNSVPLQAFMIGHQIEGDKYAFTNIRGDYLAYRDQDMADHYIADQTYLRVRKLSVSDLASNTCHLTPKQLYGKIYLAGSDGNGNGGEAIITVKNRMDETDFTLPMVTNVTSPVCDAATGGSVSSAFEFGYYDWASFLGYYINGDYLSENVSFNKANDGNYTTLYLPFPVELPAGAEAYVFSELEQAPYYQEGAVHKTRTLKTQTLTGVLPARTPAIISWDDYDNTPYTFKPAFTTGKESISDAVDDAINNSWLKGLLVNYYVTDVVTQLGLADATSIYVFYKQNDVPGFYKYSGSVLKGGRAFLVYPGDPEEVRGFVFQTSEGDMTSIGDLFDALNGIDPAADKTVYDLQGRRVANPQKGNVYIVGGKKVLMK
ncbi:MAG: exo-alpha-sialidase [Alloprevotella sp.]|nr:exo-alpha-sialidase [Alloprevotella sp.]